MPKGLRLTVLLVGGLLMGSGLGSKARGDEMEEKGISVPGKITGATTDRSAQDKKRHYLTVTWASANGEVKLTDQRHFVTRAYFEKRVRPDGKVTTPEVTVRYLKGHEEDAVLVGASTERSLMNYIGYFIGLGLFLGWRMYLWWPREEADPGVRL